MPSPAGSRPIQPLLDRLSQRLPGVRLEAYDGSASGPTQAKTTISIRSPLAFANIARAPRGLGLARAWVTGQIDVTGDLQQLTTHEHHLYDPRLILTALTTAARAVTAGGLRGPRGTGPTAIEYRARRPGTHSVESDLREVEFHYGRSAAFYGYLLGPSMTYSCGVYRDDTSTLEEAQANKHELICTKLGLDAGSTLLDVGCGWGSLLRHAHERHGSHGIGITASAAQHAYNVDATTARGAGHIRPVHGDYRQVLPLPDVTAAASVGMYEHVGQRNSVRFFGLVRACLPRGGRFLNQAIIRRPEGPRTFRRNSFVQRYIFPNGQLLSLPEQLRDLDAARFGVLSVETFGASYARTLRAWVANLERHWDACAALEGEPRVRAWHMYLTGSVTRFEDQSIDLAQVLVEAR